MNIVGQLAETVFVTVKELYRGLNPATLTGGIDVIVVRQPDGSFQCSPFHIRFGKLGVLRSKEKIVDIEINGESVDLHMKLGDNGEAFFVEENENMESQVPAHLCTSPIPLELPEEIEETTEGSFISGSGIRRKKRRRKRIRSDTHLREEASSSSDEREREKEWEREIDPAGQESPDKEQPSTPLQVSKSVYYSMSEEPNEELGATQTRDTHPHSDGEQSPSESVFLSRPSSPKSDSELLVKTQESSGPQMQWNWGGFPMVRQTLTHRHTDTHRFSVTKPNNAQKQLIKESEDCAVTATSPSSTELSSPQQPGALLEQSQQGSTSSASVSEGDSGIDPCAKGGEEEGGPGGAEGSAGGSLNNKAAPKAEWTDAGSSWTAAEGLANSSEASSKVEQQDKKKGKRNQHLGPTGIYLDDLTTLDPEVAALYFPKSETDGASQQGAEQGSCSGSQSPQSVGSGAMDSGTEYLSDSTSYNMDVSMSLCGQEGDTSQITKEKFMEHIVTYQDFANNPGIIEDPSLVICINSNYYNWAVAAPMVLSMTTFQKNLPKSTVERLVKDKMPKKSGRWWFSWRRRDMDSNQQKNSKDEQEEPLAGVSSTVQATLDDIDSDEVAGLGRKATIAPSLSTETLNTTQCINQIYRKSLRLTSEQIERLNLREGANKVVFSVTTQYQGTCRCEAAIYLWNWSDRVIISDIDGTITKSDALGHILPQFGKDWTHKGIAKLYHKIHQNGYKFLYCSARAIGMAAITKDYLQWVNDKGTVLPKGPVLLAPSSLFSALHREVIEKKPEVFKIACLSDIRDLFNPQRRPFYAAFGNRTNDAYAYKQVGVPDTRLFTVNPKGELIQEKTKGNKSSYSHLSGLVEHFFPVLSVEGSTSSALDCPEYSSFSYWKEPLPELDLDALL
uniref:phosphatidate phosphatase n=1 Tax=Dicentrarchus labrax TaxID=13489 RepID=E6ZFI0_DICLA|nr:Lipin-3 [Dicentrarchus labrax]